MFSLIRRNPYRDLASFDREMDRLFDRFLSRRPFWWDQDSEVAVFEPSQTRL